MTVHDLLCLCFWLVLMVSLNVSSSANAVDHSAKDVALLHAAWFWFWFYIHANAQVLIFKYQSHATASHIQ